MDKKTIRQIILKRRKSYNQLKSSNIVINKILNSKLINSCINIGIYFPINNEIDITSLRSIYPQKKFYLPVARDNLFFKEYTNNLIKGQFNIYEPTGAIIDRDKIDCFFIPCVGISNDMKRIGYGKGYYDRYLDGYKGLKIGICYKIDSNIECEMNEFDVFLDYIIVGWFFLISVILLMAGKGSRMNYKENKILMNINDKPLFKYSLDTFLSFGFEVICVISPIDHDKIVPLLPKNVKYVYGGKERGDSVYNGLLASTGDYVLIHDSARALISKSCINEITSNITYDSAILTYMPVKDTIKEITDKGLNTLKRDKLIAASTPQCAPKKIILSAYKKGIEDNINFTDDISLIEKYYPDFKIKLIEANQEDFKITTKIDYLLAKALIEGDNND